MKLAIAIPNTGTIKAQTAFSLCRMLKEFPHDYDVLFHEGSMLHVMRERLVSKAIELKCTHLLFIDSDMSFEKDAVIKLLKRKKEVIGVSYNKRKLPLETTIQGPAKWPNTTLTSADSVGTGFMLIDLKILKDLKKPWFFWGEDGTSEDYWFCKRVREAGYKVWCDLTIKMDHIGDYKY